MVCIPLIYPKICILIYITYIYIYILFIILLVVYIEYTSISAWSWLAEVVGTPGTGIMVPYSYSHHQATEPRRPRGDGVRSRGNDASNIEAFLGYQKNHLPLGKFEAIMYDKIIYKKHHVCMESMRGNIVSGQMLHYDSDKNSHTVRNADADVCTWTWCYHNNGNNDNSVCAIHSVHMIRIPRNVYIYCTCIDCLFFITFS